MQNTDGMEYEFAIAKQPSGIHNNITNRMWRGRYDNGKQGAVHLEYSKCSKDLRYTLRIRETGLSCCCKLILHILYRNGTAAWDITLVTYKMDLIATENLPFQQKRTEVS
ncbi:hypothetical protein AVEN_231025-1 [Araneus ventricosus]|uniref:Uncharacterized protein n=1 Tax=Araneus ventricosus TaxID=182803 RepID=A0A4Y2A5C5_ARAVE|nr:hypothetical protein AVEN_231025-1 [Araneus ventricosus]